MRVGRRMGGLSNIVAERLKRADDGKLKYYQIATAFRYHFV